MKLTTRTKLPLVGTPESVIEVSDGESYRIAPTDKELSLEVEDVATEQVVLSIQKEKDRVFSASGALSQGVSLRFERGNLLQIGDFVVFCDDRYRLPDFFHPKIAPVRLSLSRWSLLFGNELSARCDDPRYRFEAIAIVAVTWLARLRYRD